MSVKNSSCCITIPLYKTQPTQSEIASLKQCVNTLSRYDIVFVCADTFDCELYCSCIDNFDVKIERFNQNYFESIDGYNLLLLNIDFYRRLSKYDFMLIYQLDAWVFKDELYKWCQLDYDYIGAPWFEGMYNCSVDSKFIGVGNGGLSLRKIKSHIKVLKKFSYIVNPIIYLKAFLKGPTIDTLLTLLINTTLKNNTYYLFNNYTGNEDWFWCMIVGRKFHWFKIPSLEVALKFSIEVHPSNYINSGEDLPFGCHAWEKCEPDFWRNYINVNK